MGIASKQTKRHNKKMLDIHKIISLVPGIIYQFRLRPDGSSCVPFASEAAREIYRLDPEEIREDASKAFTHVHPDDLESLLASILASARDLTPWQHEYRLKFDDGVVRWLYGNALPQREADGSTLWHGFITDITERKNSEERLRQNEEKLRAYLDNISDTIWLIDAYLNMAYVSPSVTRLLGILPEELIGRPSALVIHPDDMEVVINAQRYVMEHPGEPHTVQYRVSHKDGRWIHVESTGVNMLGNPVIGGVLVAMRDISERKHTERLLRESEARFRNLADHAPALVWMADTNNFGVWYNKRWLEHTGRTMEQELGFGWIEGMHPDDRQRCATFCQTAFDGRQKFDMEFRLRRADGTYGWVADTGAPRFDDGGKFLGYVGYCWDITERKQAEQALAESESRFREIFNAVDDAIFIHDAETGRIVDVNRRMCEMYGVTREEALACGPDDLSAGVPPYSSAEAVGKIRLARIKGPQTFDWLARKRDGRYFWVEVSLRLAHIGNQQLILAVVRDISERKHIDAELRIAATAFESQDGMVITDADA